MNLFGNVRNTLCATGAKFAGVLSTLTNPADAALDIRYNRRIAGSPDRRIAGSPDRRIAGSPDRRIAGSPDRRIAGSPDRRIAGSPNLRPRDGHERSRMAAPLLASLLTA